MDGAKGLIKALENWAKKVTAGYRDVDVRDMSSSFRNGLAFCAIIHHYRPDLIDFDSLAKENIFENNSMAFSVAEKQLGVPALLDAEDMVKFTRPDRLSIITYLSQLRNCFENQNKVSSLRSGVKRVKAQSSGPPEKVTVTSPQLLPMKRHETCQVCKHRVFILERLIVDGKLYHTACFRCCKCNCLLNPGAYVESDSPGIYECSVCLSDENIDFHETELTDEYKIQNDKVESSCIVLLQKSQNENLMKQSPLSESVTHARNNFLKHSLSVQNKSNGTSSNSDKFTFAVDTPVKQTLEDVVITVKDKISAFEASQVPNTRTSFQQPSLLRASNRELSLNAPLKPAPSNESPSITCTATDPNETVSPTSFDASPKGAENFTAADQCPSSKSAENKSEMAADGISPTLTAAGANISPDSKDLASDKLGFNRQLSSLNEYKSPIRKPRDIFQSSIRPLKLSIPSVISTAKRESNSSSVTASTSSPGSSKNFELPPIKSVYSFTLPRQNSFTGAESKEKSLANASGDRSESRRRSLESNDNGKISTRDSLGAVSLSAVDKKSVSYVDSGKKANSAGGFSFPSELAVSSSKVPLSKSLGDGRPPEGSETEGNNLESLNSESHATKDPHGSFSFENGEKSLRASSGKSRPSDARNGGGVSNKTVTSESAAVVQDEPGYPDDLNPFGSDVESNGEEYPDDLNPFGDDEPVVTADSYDESKNPFASDTEDTESAVVPDIPPQSATSPLSSESFSLPQTDSFSTLSSPNGSLKGTVKKRQAPKPPKVSDVFRSDLPDSDISRPAGMSPSTRKKNLETPSPKVRKNKPAPLPPTARQSSDTDVAADSKHTKEVDNMKLKTHAPTGAEEDGKRPAKNVKKKRPAPPVPIPVRRDMKKIPLKEILREMKEIEEKQREYEKQGREIELLIRDRDKDEEPSVEEEEYIMQLFELVNQKNALFRRQAELMYIKRSQRLEEQQYEIEKHIRLLMAKPESEKTDEDIEKEQELTMELIDIVDQRNSIIDSIEMDRRREMEEDISVQEQIEIKNGDLPITAELKEKSSGKDKKGKSKKDKKKQKTNGESGKITVKKKKWHLSKGT